MARIQLLLALAAVCGAALAAGPAAQAQDKRPAVELIRGATPVPDTNSSGIYKMERHDRVIPRNHSWQPPIIPHNVKGYQITKNVNMCMSCHAAKSAPRTGATPVAKSHYLDRDGNALATISTRRYFCLQCHVPQFDAEQLVQNTFQPAK
jgi:nitrate reductase (cytochrome), electron transfer subunit